MPKARSQFFLFVLIAATFLWPTLGRSQDSPAPSPASSAPAPVPGLDVPAMVKAGIEKGQQGDLDGAISTFNEALKIDPKSATAYGMRGYALSLQQKFDLAMADYNQSILLDDKNALTYFNRGTARAQQGDLDGALADFQSALAINPKYAQARYNLGHVKYFKGDLPGALTDLNQAIALAPNISFPYYIRGLVRHAQNDQPGALADFQQSVQLHFAYGAFWVWILQSEKGDAAAHADLLTTANKFVVFLPGAWPSSIATFLLGNLTQDQLLARAAQNTQDKSLNCEAWFYAGTVKRLGGDKKGALDCFQQAIATGSTDSEEYIEAQREAAKLSTP